jgi:uncharacterized membrane protein (DUF2068 family)
MKILLLTLIFGGLALIDLPGLFRKKQWAEFIASSVIFSIGFFLSLFQMIGVKLPNPNKGIEYLIRLIIP